MSERLARRFATRLRRLYVLLSEAIEGPESAELRLRYAALLIYRLIFLSYGLRTEWFGEHRRSLQQRLAERKQEQGSTDFYRDVLRPCFRGEGQWPGFSFPLTDLFTSHSIEQACPKLAIPDEIFAQIFALFDEQGQQIGRHGSEADIYGDLIAQNLQPEEMGAYYTPGEVTAYIARNTLFPALFTRTRASSSLFDQQLWQQLLRQPQRYLFAAMRQGCEQALPPEIEAGLQDITQRTTWQARAPASYALPGETWRTLIARRAQQDRLLTALQRQRQPNPERLVTWNVDQQRLTLETLEHCQQPELLLSFYQSLRQFTVLDPTCGSGAFLEAALSQLAPLHAACLARMEQFLATSLSSPLRQACEQYLTQAGDCAHRDRTIVQWISAHTLYGVDLMEEAVEICRLRLALKVQAAAPWQMYSGLASDTGQHIRVGNSLSGSPGEARQAHNQADTAAFHWAQAFPAVMARGGFDVVLGNPPYIEYQRVRQLYTLDGYATRESGNLFALTIERSAQLLAPGGRFGMIVPSSATCTDGYQSLQRLLLSQQELHIASFSDQRGRLFELSHPRLCIILYAKPTAPAAAAGRVFSTAYLKLGKESRRSLFEHLSYTEVTDLATPGVIPRYGSPLERTIAAKLARQARTLGSYLSASGPYPVYYTRKLSWFVQVTPFIPLILDARGQARTPSELKTLRFSSPVHAQLAFAALNSTLFYWLITTGSDCRNLNRREVAGFPLDLASVSPMLQQKLCQLSEHLGQDLQRQARMRVMNYRAGGSLTIQCIYPARSQALIDQIDRLLARHYRFSAEEEDFLLHYDETYRRSQTAGQVYAAR
ncbi:MAG TPA: DNA methyltransferase [Ktedonobacteraceae bacterium]